MAYAFFIHIFRAHTRALPKFIVSKNISFERRTSGGSLLPLLSSSSSQNLDIKILVNENRDQNSWLNDFELYTRRSAAVGITCLFHFKNTNSKLSFCQSPLDAQKNATFSY